MVNAPFLFQAHVTIAWLLSAVWPYTRLVHGWSVPVGYLVRSPIVYRAKRGATRTALR
jgi:nitrate reductase gamma subunit